MHGETVKFVSVIVIVIWELPALFSVYYLETKLKTHLNADSILDFRKNNFGIYVILLERNKYNISRLSALLLFCTGSRLPLTQPILCD